MSELYRAGHLDLVAPSRGPKPHVYEMTQKALLAGTMAALPDPELVFPNEFQTADKGYSFAENKLKPEGESIAG